MKRILAAGMLAGVPLVGVSHADSFQNFSEAAGDSSEAGARVIAAGGQVALGAVAVPLVVVGTIAEETGGAANMIGNDIWAAANQPLTVDRDVVVAQPAPSLTPSTSQAE